MMFILTLLSAAFAQEATVSVVDLPCHTPFQEVAVVNVNAIQPSLTGDRRYMMERAIALTEAQARATERCTEQLGDTLAKLEVAKATAEQIRRGGVVKTASTSGGNIATSTQEAALGYGGSYGSYGGAYVGSIEDTRTRIADAQRLLNDSRKVRAGTAGGGSAVPIATVAISGLVEDPIARAVRLQHEADAAKAKAIAASKQ